MNKKLVAGIIVVVGALFYFVFSSLGGSSVYYITVGELKAMGPSAYEKTVRVAGKVVEGSIHWDPQTLTLTFEIADESGKLPVVYHGPRPDLLRDGAEAVVEGRYTPEGIFKVNPKGLLLKCPSRYQEKSR